MYAIRIAHLIDTRADTIVERVIEKLLRNRDYRILRDVPAQELKRCMRDIYSHLAESLLLNARSNLDERYIALGMRRAQQGVNFSDLVLSLLATKECFWEWIEHELLQGDPQERFEYPEFLIFVSRFFDRIIIAAAIGYDSIHDPGDGHPALIAPWAVLRL
jgi:hypothetical protein